MRTAVVSQEIAAPIGPFSPAVRDGDMLYSSGHVGQDPATGRVVEESAAGQTAQILTNLAAVLRAGGKSFDDVVKVNVYLTDMNDFAAMNTVYARHFSAPYPARTTVAVSALPLGARVEIEVVAR